MGRSFRHDRSGDGVESFVVVALPRADDYVWKVSSEQVPHMTLLYLNGNMANANDVASFIKHASDTMLKEFAVGVERRGTLGDKSADVLFFSESSTQQLADFRMHLRGNNDIETAYQSVEQYPNWTPHLTLGYPETPAKVNAEDMLSLYAVTFDRIALWTGDYEGVEFPLSKDDMIVAMGDSIEDFLAHYGVLGMRWGVRRAEGPDGRVKNLPVPVETSHKPGRRVKAKGGKRLPASDDAVRVAAIKQRARKSTTDSLSNKELQDLVTRLNLEAQYDRLGGGSALQQGNKILKDLIGIGRQSKEAYNVGQTLMSDIRKSSS